MRCQQDALHEEVPMGLSPLLLQASASPRWRVDSVSLESQGWPASRLAEKITSCSSALPLRTCLGLPGRGLKTFRWPPDCLLQAVPLKAKMEAACLQCIICVTLQCPVGYPACDFTHCSCPAVPLFPC